MLSESSVFQTDVLFPTDFIFKITEQNRKSVYGAAVRRVFFSQQILCLFVSGQVSLEFLFSFRCWEDPPPFFFYRKQPAEN